jgi:hypothetical protein
MTEKCSATTKDGAPCGMNPKAGARYCFNHARTAGADEARAAARRAGGRARTARTEAQQELAGEAKSPPHWWGMREPWEVAAALAHTTREVLAGRLDAKRGAIAVKALSRLAPLVEKYHRGNDDGDGSDDGADYNGRGGAREDDEDDLDEAA